MAGDEITTLLNLSNRLADIETDLLEVGHDPKVRSVLEETGQLSAFNGALTGTQNARRELSDTRSHLARVAG